MDREQLKKAVQVGLLVVAVVAAGAATWRYLASREGDISFRGPTEEVVPTPARGPIGMHPNLDIRGWGDAEVTVFFCAPDSTAHTDRCAELVKGRSGDTVRSASVAAIPATLPEGIEVTPEVYMLRAGTGEGEEPYPQRGTFEVIPFQIGDPPEPRTYPPAAPLSLGDEREIAQGASCGVEVTPDNRIVVGASLVNPGTGVITEFGLEGAELSWAPTRDRLAIVTADRKEIRLAEPDGGAVEAVVREARGLISSVTWAPEGDRFAYIARSEPGVRGGPGAPQVYLFSLVQGAQGALGRGESVAWSPVEEQLAVEAAGGVIELLSLDGNRTRLTEGRRPAWSPDGSLVVFLRLAGADAGEVWVTPAEGEPARLEAERVCGVAFTADGARLVLAVRVEGGPRLVVREIRVGRG